MLDLLTSRLKGCPRHHKGQAHKPHKAEVKAVFENLFGRPQNHAGTKAPDRQVHGCSEFAKTLLQQGQAAVALGQTFGKHLAKTSAQCSSVWLAYLAVGH